MIFTLKLCSTPGYFRRKYIDNRTAPTSLFLQQLVCERVAGADVEGPCSDQIERQNDRSALPVP